MRDRFCAGTSCSVSLRTASRREEEHVSSKCVFRKGSKSTNTAWTSQSNLLKRLYNRNKSFIYYNVFCILSKSLRLKYTTYKSICCLAWVWNLVSHTNGRIQAEGLRGQCDGQKILTPTWRKF